MNFILSGDQPVVRGLFHSLDACSIIQGRTSRKVDSVHLDVMLRPDAQNQPFGIVPQIFLQTF